MLMVVEASPAEATFPGPNGQIAYAVLNSGIYTINPGGGGKSKVTDTLVSSEAKPSYSPNGKRIADSDYDGNGVFKRVAPTPYRPTQYEYAQHRKQCG